MKYRAELHKIYSFQKFTNMKRYFCLILVMQIWAVTLAQELKLNFVPVSPENTIDSIMVVNVTRSEVNILYNTNSINLTTAITDFTENSEYIRLFSDHLNHGIGLAFHSKYEKTVNLAVYDLSGRKILYGNYSVKRGENQFIISLSKPGLYIVSLLSDSFMDSRKFFLSENFSNRANELVYEEIQLGSLTEKSSVNEEADLYHFYVYSGDMITKIADRPTVAKTYDVEFYKCQDAAGNNYPVVKIGEQWWMAKNLHYLPHVNKTSDLSIKESGYCYVYDYNGYGVNLAMQTEYYQIYGVLYNWLTAQEYCPNGWHIPDKEEWMNLAIYINDQKGPFETSEFTWLGVGEYLKSGEHWTNKQNCDDIYGFSALPGGTFTTSGKQFAEEGEFKLIEEVASWWSTHTWEMHVATSFFLESDNNNFSFSYNHRHDGKSVRCVKDYE